MTWQDLHPNAIAGAWLALTSSRLSTVEDRLRSLRALVNRAHAELLDCIADPKVDVVRFATLALLEVELAKRVEALCLGFLRPERAANGEN